MNRSRLIGILCAAILILLLVFSPLCVNAALIDGQMIGETAIGFDDPSEIYDFSKPEQNNMVYFGDYDEYYNYDSRIDWLSYTPSVTSATSYTYNVIMNPTPADELWMQTYAGAAQSLSTTADGVILNGHLSVGANLFGSYPFFDIDFENFSVNPMPLPKTTASSVARIYFDVTGESIFTI